MKILLKDSRLVSLTYLLSLLLFFGCGADDDQDVSLHGDLSGEFQFPLDATGPLWQVPDAYIAEAINTLTPDWYLREDPDWYKMGYHGQLLKQFGDIPEVRYLIAFHLNPKEKTKAQFIAKTEALYRLFPNEENLEVMRQTTRLPDPTEPPRVETNREWATRDPEGYYNHLLAALIRKYGEIPQVYIVATYSTKLTQGKKLTDAESEANNEAVAFLMNLDEQEEKPDD